MHHCCHTAGPDWRSKQELLSALEVAVPQAALAQHKANRASVFDTGNADGHDGDRGSIQDGGPVGSVACTGGNWMSSLRNANERLLQVRHLGLGCLLLYGFVGFLGPLLLLVTYAQ
jgi:hypothetical protein